MRVSKLINIALVTTAVLLTSAQAPAHAVIYDPHLGGNVQSAPAHKTQEQISEEMRSPKTVPPVGVEDPISGYKNGETVNSSRAPDIKPPAESAPTESSVKVIEGNTIHSDTIKHSNHLAGIAITAALLGLICIGALVAVKKGPKPSDL